MFRRFVDLKKHYGTDTMIEVVLDANRRSELTNRPLYKNGRVIRMFFSIKDGLVAYDYNTMGIGVIRKVDERYLEALTISAVDFAIITGKHGRDNIRIDVDELVDSIKVDKDSNYKDNIVGISIVVGLTVCAIAGSLLRGNSPPTTPVTPKAKTTRR